MEIMLALSKGRLIGTICSDQYTGAESKHPHGFKHLLDAGIDFDLIDVSCDSATTKVIDLHIKASEISVERKIAMRLSGIHEDDLTTAERQISKILIESCHLKKDEYGNLIEP